MYKLETSLKDFVYNVDTIKR